MVSCSGETANRQRSRSSAPNRKTIATPTLHAISAEAEILGEG
jgi:hypothetical protein